MFVAVLVAVALLFSGSTFLKPVLDPRVHPSSFILFWFACAWITLLAALLAVFDMLLVRAQARAAKKTFAKGDFPNSRLAKLARRRIIPA